MPRALLAITLLAMLHVAATAGPYCGGAAMFAPAETTTLPVGPTIAFATEHPYYDGKRTGRARPMALTATIDGKRVGLRTRDVAMSDGVIRFVTVTSRRSGKLELWTRDRFSNERVIAAEYTIDDAADRPTTATATVLHTQDQRLGPYHRIGDQMAIRVDVPATAFELRWRHAGGTWHERSLPATVEDGHTDARLGETVCGFSSNLPAAELATGIEVELTAILADRSKLPVTGIANPVVMTNEKVQQLD
jgi:hypothetical protein